MNEKVQNLLKSADIAFINGQYEKSLELCQEVIEINPENVDARTGAGKVCIVLEKLDEALTYFEEAIELDSTNGERYFNLANVKFGLGKFNEALINYAKAEQLDCNDEIKQKIYYQIGVINQLTGNKKAALVNYNKSENIGNINPDAKDILIKKIQIYVETEDFINAENAAIQYKMIAPNEFKSYLIYIQILMTTRKYDKIEKVLEEIELYVDDKDLLSNKVEICIIRASLLSMKADQDKENRFKYYEQSLANFDQFLNQEDITQNDLDLIYFSKAEIYMKLERFDEAIKSLEEIQDKINDVDKANFIKLSCYMGLAQYENTSKIIDLLKATQNAYYNYFAIYSEAFIANKTSNINKADIYNFAIAYFKNKTFENPGDIFSLIFRTRIYAEYGKFNKAEELIQLFPETLKLELQQYVEQCKKEYN